MALDRWSRSSNCDQHNLSIFRSMWSKQGSFFRRVNCPCRPAQQKKRPGQPLRATYVRHCCQVSGLPNPAQLTADPPKMVEDHAQIEYCCSRNFLGHRCDVVASRNCARSSGLVCTSNKKMVGILDKRILLSLFPADDDGRKASIFGLARRVESQAATARWPL